jgi:hypothetical protein
MFSFPGLWLVPGRIHHLISQTQLSVISLRLDQAAKFIHKPEKKAADLKPVKKAADLEG